jgi:hypothetical protein
MWVWFQIAKTTKGKWKVNWVVVRIAESCTRKLTKSKLKWLNGSTYKWRLDSNSENASWIAR